MSADVPTMVALLQDGGATLFARYEAMFTLRDIGGMLNLDFKVWLGLGFG